MIIWTPATSLTHIEDRGNGFHRHRRQGNRGNGFTHIEDRKPGEQTGGMGLTHIEDRGTGGMGLHTSKTGNLGNGQGEWV